MPNQAPQVVGAVPAQELAEGDTATLVVASFFRDPDGDPLTYTAASSDVTVASASASGTRVTIRALAAGSATVTVTASDPGGLSASQEFEVNVVPGNQAPEAVGSIPVRELGVGQYAAFDVSSFFRDPDGDSLGYAAESSDATVALASVSGAMIVIAASAPGTVTVTVTASDPGGLTATQSVGADVEDGGNRTPQISRMIVDQTAYVAVTTTLDLSSYFWDPDGDSLTYSARKSSGDAATISVSGDELTISGVSLGTVDIEVTSTDPGNLTSMQAFAAMVSPSPPVAVGEIPQDTLETGETATVDLSDYFSDPAGEPLTFEATAFFDRIAKVSVSGSVMTVEGLAEGNTSITATATDPGGLNATQQTRVNVAEPNEAPVPKGTIPDLTLDAGRTRSVFVASYFEDRDNLNYSAASSDDGVAGATIEGSRVKVTGVARGAATVTVTARDPGGLEATQGFAVSVPNSPPEETERIPGDTLDVGDAATLDLSEYFADPDGDPLIFEAEPFFDHVLTATVSGSRLRIAGVEDGRTSVTITARDPEGLEASQRPRFRVIQPNRPPEVTEQIPDDTVAAGRTTFVLLFSHFEDPDRDRLTYSATSSNESVATVTASGSSSRVTGVARGTAEITVSARDPGGLEARQSYGITVPNTEPDAVGDIPSDTLNVGEKASIDLSPYFADPDGDPLSYTAEVFFDHVVRATVSGSVLTVQGLQDGRTFVTVTARDPEGLEASQRTRFRIMQPNRAPVATDPIPAQEVELDKTRLVSMSSHFEDPDRDRLTYLVESSDPGVVGVTASTFSVRLAGVSKGSATVAVVARDPGGLEARQSFNAKVPNSAPDDVGDIPDGTLNVGETLSLDLFPYFTDPDGDPLTYTAEVFFDLVASATVSGTSLAVQGLADGRTSVTVTARDPEGLEATQRVRFRIIQPNRAPVSTDEIPDQVLSVGDTFWFLAFSYFSDPDRDQLTYTAETSNAGVATVTVSGSRVTIEAVAAGAATITVRATDPDGLSAEQDVIVAVEQDNRAPRAVGSIGARTVSAGSSVTVDVSSGFTDPDGDALSYSARSSRPAVATAAAAGSRVTIRGVSGGAATVTVTARDPDGLSARQRISVTVGNRAPVATSVPAQVFGLDGIARVDLSAYFSDPDGDRLTFTGSSADDGIATASVVGSRLTVRPVSAGTTTVSVIATDPGRLSAREDIAVTVQAGVNRPPTGSSIPSQALGDGGSVILDLASYFSDPDNDPLVFEGSSDNHRVATTDVVGSSLTIRALGPGTATVTATARDPGGLTASREISVSVARPDNQAPQPTGTIPDETLNADESVSIRLSTYFDDPDADALTYSAAVSDSRVATASVSGSTLTATGKASGTVTVTITAQDVGGLEATQRFDLTVRNSPPEAVGTVPPASILVNTTTTIAASSYFRDRDADQLSFAAETSNTAVATASVSGSVVTLSGVSAGTAMVTLTAADPGGLEARQHTDVTVRATNRSPTVTRAIPAQTLEAGSSTSVNAGSHFEDPDDDPLTYTTSTSDATVVTASVSGTVVTFRARSAGTATMTLTATDPLGASVAHDVRIDVEQGNRPPQPSGTIPAQSIEAGGAATVDVSSYFTDPDGDALAYSVASSNSVVATASRTGSDVTISARAPGTATVSVTARDTDGASAVQTVSVTVTGQQDNRPPKREGEIPVHFLDAGESVEIEMSDYFSDPDGDDLSYDVATSRAGVVRGSDSEGTLTITGMSRGTATVTVTAADPDRSEAEASFSVAVMDAGSGSYDIDLISITPMSESHAAAFRDAAEKWMAVLADTELPDMPVRAGTPTGCWDLTSDREVESVDDLLLVVSVREIDGPGGTLAAAGSCRSRDDSMLPWMGMIEFDEDDLNSIAADGGLEEVVRHEMAHTLGFNRFLWSRLDLLENPTLTWFLFAWAHSPGEDTHFSGSLAKAAFDEAGGTSYTAGSKVPLENCRGQGSGDSHWREFYWTDDLPDSGCREGEALLGGELMSPVYNRGARSPLSRITLQVFADLGYSVDLGEAEEYSLPTAGRVVTFDPKRMIEYGDDTAKGPITVYDRSGRPVRVIPN